LKRFPSRASNLLQRGDLAHYCAQFVNRDPVDKILNRFDSFYIAGQQSSVPYLQKRITALGKRFVLIPSYAPQVINGLAEPCQCLLICGAMGRFDIDLPAAALQFTEHSWHLQMMPELDLDKVPFNTLPSQISHDWFYPYDRVRHSNHADFVRSRTADRAARARPKSGLA
jgi:hypothetical protein